MARTFAEKFGAAPELWVRAPGRVDLMGSHQLRRLDIQDITQPAAILQYILQGLIRKNPHI
jgi:hypothetical protein